MVTPWNEEDMPLRANDNTIIMDFLTTHHEDIRKAIAPYEKQRLELLKGNPKSMHDKINSQFKQLSMYTIAEGIGDEYGVDTETVIVFLESFDLMNYLDGDSAEWCR